MNQTWNQFVVKNGNKSIVLDTIKKHSPISRADIAQSVGLNKGTVSSLVSELLEEDLIYESGPGLSSGGRRPVMLLFNQIAGYSIGIDLGVNYLLGLLIDLNGNIINEKKINFNQLTFSQIQRHLFEMIDHLISSAPKSAYGIIGIGVGVPGIVSKSGEILLAPNLEWKHVHLKEIIESRYDVPVIIENEANAGAYGEKKYGISQNFDNIIYVSAGIGIGTGLILNGNLYRGSNGFSGELGHMVIKANGLKCRCGNMGCWELYASERALLKKAESSGILPRDRSELALESLNKLAADGHEETISLMKETGDYLGIGLTSIINTFNPQQVVIGNRMASSLEWLKPTLTKRIKDNTIGFHQRDLQIDFSELHIHSAALGVSAFTVENFLKIDLVQQ
jgi:glucokinase-like ROK family protein